MNGNYLEALGGLKRYQNELYLERKASLRTGESPIGSPGVSRDANNNQIQGSLPKVLCSNGAKLNSKFQSPLIRKTPLPLSMSNVASENKRSLVNNNDSEEHIDAANAGLDCETSKLEATILKSKINETKEASKQNDCDFVDGTKRQYGDANNHTSRIERILAYKKKAFNQVDTGVDMNSVASRTVTTGSIKDACLSFENADITIIRRQNNSAIHWPHNDRSNCDEGKIRKRTWLSPAFVSEKNVNGAQLKQSDKHIVSPKKVSVGCKQVTSEVIAVDAGNTGSENSLGTNVEVKNGATSSGRPEFAVLNRSKFELVFPYSDEVVLKCNFDAKNFELELLRSSNKAVRDCKLKFDLKPASVKIFSGVANDSEFCVFDKYLADSAVKIVDYYKSARLVADELELAITSDENEKYEESLMYFTIGKEFRDIEWPDVSWPMIEETMPHPFECDQFAFAGFDLEEAFLECPLVEDCDIGVKSLTDDLFSSEELEVNLPDLSACFDVRHLVENESFSQVLGLENDVCFSDMVFMSPSLEEFHEESCDREFELTERFEIDYVENLSEVFPDIPPENTFSISTLLKIEETESSKRVEKCAGQYELNNVAVEQLSDQIDIAVLDLNYEDVLRHLTANQLFSRHKNFDVTETRDCGMQTDIKEMLDRATLVNMEDEFVDRSIYRKMNLNSVLNEQKSTADFEVNNVKVNSSNNATATESGLYGSNFSNLNDTSDTFERSQRPDPDYDLQFLKDSQYLNCSQVSEKSFDNFWSQQSEKNHKFETAAKKNTSKSETIPMDSDKGGIFTAASQNRGMLDWRLNEFERRDSRPKISYFENETPELKSRLKLLFDKQFSKQNMSENNQMRDNLYFCGDTVDSENDSGSGSLNFDLNRTRFNDTLNTSCDVSEIAETSFAFSNCNHTSPNGNNLKFNCSDPTCGGRNYILKWVFFFCSVNFGRSIYSS